MADTKILNEEQIEAITFGEGPLLIIAGAGTGKTTVITERIKHLILNLDVSPQEILALTFTEKSASEMEERIDIAMPYGYTNMWISTFHAFCDRIIRNEAVHIGLNPSYTLASEAEAIQFLKNNIFKFDLNYFRPLGNPTKFLSGMLQHFSRLKDEDITPDQYVKYANKLKTDKDVDPLELKKTQELAQAFKMYEELKAQEGIMDFSDLIANTLTLFRERPNILKNYQDQFKYILIDEFQDTNFAQNTLAILLTGQRKNITVVGDDDQAIYRWRGAAISNIIQFRAHFPKTKIVTLTQNYRSTKEILEKAYTLIQHNNPDRLEIKENVNKKLTSVRNVKGEACEFLFADRVEDEAEMVVDKIIHVTKNKKYEYKDIAILVRANDHAQPFTRILQQKNIPFQFLGPEQLFQQEEIKDLIAYLKILYNFEDSPSLYRVLCMPIFALEARDIAALLNYARKKNISLFLAIETLIKESAETDIEIFLQNSTKEKLYEIYTMINKHLGKISQDTAGQILYYFLEDSGILKDVLQTTVGTDEKKYQNIARFFEKLKSYEVEHKNSSVFAIVDWIDLAMQLGESPRAANVDWTENNAVNILTIHSSKGLEFPIVFLVNLVSQRFPTRERKEQLPIPQDLIKEILPEGDYHMQEERRLFYVGLTRAKDIAFLTAANFYGEGKRERKISPFVVETLGEKETSKYLLIAKEKKLAIQPSLLEWAETMQSKNIKKPDVKPNTTVSESIITYISYSQIQCFDMCPLHYKLRYLLKIPVPPSPAQSYGISIHSALKEFYYHVMKGKKLKPEDIIPMLEKNWIREGYTSKVHDDTALLGAKASLVKHLEKNYDSSLKKSQPLGVETPFQFFIKNKESQALLKIGGRIDRIDQVGNKIHIIDYKTGSTIPSEKDVAKDLQLSLYALAAINVRDTVFNRKPEEIVLTLHYLETDMKISTTRTAQQLEEAQQLVWQRVHEISQSDYSCSRTHFCETCEYKMLCSTLT